MRGNDVVKCCVEKVNKGQEVAEICLKNAYCNLIITKPLNNVHLIGTHT